MKTIIVIGLAMSVIIGGMMFIENEHEVVNDVEVKVPTAEEELEQAVQKMIEEAITASSSDITTAKEEAARKVEEDMKADIEARVRESIRLKVDPNWREDVATPKEKVATPVARNEIERLIIETFPEDPQTALAIARAESGLNPRAINAGDNHGVCKGSYGVFQVGCVHGIPPETLYDPVFNIKKARKLYDERGWEPWGAYTNGSFRKHMAML